MLEQHLPDADGIVAGRFWPDKFAKADNLKALFIPFAGYDAFDIEQIAQRGVIIANSHGASSYVAERAIGLAISLLGKICYFSRELREGCWHRGEFWTAMQDLKIGIWGVGSIGKNIARLLSGFHCPAFGFSRKKKSQEKYFDEIFTDVDKFIEIVDIFFITIPLTNSTRGSIDEIVLGKMNGKYLIHISRGPVVEEKALYNALKNGILKGASLDCWYNYPRGKKQPILPSAYPFHKLDNILLSPHACSHTDTARAANIEMTRKNIDAFIDTGMPISIVEVE